MGRPKKKRASASFHFKDSLESSFLEIKQYLEKLGASTEDSAATVTLILGDASTTVDATVLAALSPHWRKLLHDSIRDTSVVVKILLDVSSGMECLHMIKSLLYFGKATLSVSLIKDVMNILHYLQFESSDFVLTNSGNQLESLIWENHFDRLTKGLQDMCKEQLSTDFCIVVDNHLIKVHMFVLSAYSGVLEELFRENKKIRTLHIKGVPVNSAESLVTFMYYGSGFISQSDKEKFSKLCSSLNVKRLIKVLNHGHSSVATLEITSENASNVSAKVVPEVNIILKKLQCLYDQEGKTDLTLLVGGKRIYTHKSILGISCPSIHSMLMEEDGNEQSAILISDADSVSISCLLTLIYNGACFMTKSQLEIVTSYLDSNLFHVDISNDVLLAQQDSADILKISQEESSIPFVKPKNPSAPIKQPVTTRVKKSYKQIKKKSLSSVFSESSRSSVTDEKMNESDTAFSSIASDVSENSASCSGLNAQSNVKKGNCLQFSKSGTTDSFAEPVINTYLKTNTENLGIRILTSKRKRRSKVFSDDWITDMSEASFLSPPNLIRKEKYEKNCTRLPGTYGVFCKLCHHHVAEKEIVGHMQSHGGTQCGCCKQCFPTENHLYQHLQRKYSLGETENYSVNDDTVVEEPSRSYACVDCSSSFDTKRKLDLHFRKHKREKKSEYKTNMKCRNLPEGLHLKNKSRKGPRYICNYCRLRCVSSDTLLRHINSSIDCQGGLKRRKRGRPKKISTESDGESTNISNFCWLCSLCTFRCSEYEELRVHINDVHAVTKSMLSEGVSGAEDFVQTPTHSCDVAPKTADDYGNFCDRSFMCPECGEQFDNIENYYAHADQRGHGSFRGSGWICGICKTAFFKEEELNDHLASHEPVPGHMMNPTKKQTVNVLEHMPPGSASGFVASSSSSGLVSPEKLLSKPPLVNKKDLCPKNEADSSVMDDGHGAQDELVNSRHEHEINNVTSSVNNEKTLPESSPQDTHIRNDLKEILSCFD